MNEFLAFGQAVAVGTGCLAFGLGIGAVCWALADVVGGATTR